MKHNHLSNLILFYDASRTQLQQSILKQNTVFKLKRSLLLFLIIIITLILSKVNVVYAMEHGEAALDIAKALIEDNENEANRLLDILRSANLTDAQFQQINNVINHELQLHHVEHVGVNNLEVHNAGVPPNTEPFNTRNFLITLGIAATCTLSVYLLFRYWGEVRDFFFDIGRHAVGNGNLRNIVLNNFQLVRHNPHAIQAIAECLNTMITDIPDPS